ncbi:hypothetical protein BKI52_43095 [marine bacterium AO1-C]|nr:hypothetical protein BKI52_43095 [marine bacterium AO1-C]
MENLFIEAGDYSPKVDFNTSTNVFEIVGDSFGEDTFTFFEPIIKWLEAYLKKNTRPLELSIEMNYLNSSSFKRFNELLSLLENYHTNTQTPVKVIWVANPDDDDVVDYGEDIKDYFDELPIHIELKASS